MRSPKNLSDRDLIASGNAKVLKARLENPKDSLYEDPYSIIRLACQLPAANRLVPILMKAGFPIEKDGETLLHILCECPSKTLESEDYDLRKHWLLVYYMLIEKLGIEVRDQLNRTPLMVAVQSGRFNTAFFLRGEGAAFDGTYPDGSTLFGATYRAMGKFIIDGRESTQDERLAHPMVSALVAAGRLPNDKDLKSIPIQEARAILEGDMLAIISRKSATQMMSARPRRSIFDRIPNKQKAPTDGASSTGSPRRL